MIQIKCEDLTLGYDGQAVASDINFVVNKGDYLCIVGENGSGKSTLIKTLIGLEKPISGNITTENNFDLKHIGYLPQQTDIQINFPASVKEIVTSGVAALKKISFSGKKYKDIVISNMKRLNIYDLQNKNISELSGGQQQRVYLTRALCASKGVLFLDEPISGLDPLVTAEMYDILKNLNSDGETIIMVSHDILSAVKYATNILHIGKSDIFFGTVSDYLKSDIGISFMKGDSQND